MAIIATYQYNIILDTKLNCKDFCYCFLFSKKEKEEQFLSPTGTLAQLTVMGQYRLIANFSFISEFF